MDLIYSIGAVHSLEISGRCRWWNARKRWSVEEYGSGSERQRRVLSKVADRQAGRRRRILLINKSGWYERPCRWWQRRQLSLPPRFYVARADTRARRRARGTVFPVPGSSARSDPRDPTAPGRRIPTVVVRRVLGGACTAASTRNTSAARLSTACIPLGVWKIHGAKGETPAGGNSARRGR